MEGELQTQANEIINRNIEQIQKLNAFEDQLLGSHNLPQILYSVQNTGGIPDDIWGRVEDFQKKGSFNYLENLHKGVELNRTNCSSLLTKCESSILTEE